MAIIIKKIDGKPVFNALNITEEEKKRAFKLDDILAKVIPKIEKDWTEKRMKKKKARKIDMKLAYATGKKLSEIVENKKLAHPSERKWIWKAIREMYLKRFTIKKRSATRDDLEYLYQASKYPWEFIKNFSWDSWRRLLDSPSLGGDKRFEDWLQKKAKDTGIIKRGFLRQFSKNLYFLIKNKDTTVLSDRKVFEIYEDAWRLSTDD